MQHRIRGPPVVTSRDGRGEHFGMLPSPDAVVAELADAPALGAGGVPLVKGMLRVFASGAQNSLDIINLHQRLANVLDRLDPP